MKQGRVLAIQESFAGGEDPRESNRRHLLMHILMIAICAAICSADTRVEVAEPGKPRRHGYSAS